jgi:hypothetical protein
MAGLFVQSTDRAIKEVHPITLHLDVTGYD